MDPLKFTWRSGGERSPAAGYRALFPELIQNLQSLAVHDNEVVRLVFGDVHEPLFGICRERESRGVGWATTVEECLLDVFPVHGEDLNTPIRAIRHVNKAIVGNPDGMSSPELLRPFCARCLRAGTLCSSRRRRAERHVTEGAPHAFEGAGVGVKYDHAQVALVTDEYFVGLAINKHVGGSVHILRILRAGALTTATDLQR